jgi:acyl-CoA reductase-like NAD-dependent aldehyde dehydrogenase
MPKWTLTATSRTGDKVNPLTGADHDSVAVYDKADLDRRLAAAKTDPRNLDVTIRKEN